MTLADAIQLGLLVLMAAACIVGAPLWVNAQFAKLAAALHDLALSVRAEIVASRHKTMGDLQVKFVEFDQDIDDLKQRVTRLESRGSD